MKNKNSLLERFDRSIAGGTWKQLMWFAAFVIGLLALFITYAHFRNLVIFEDNVNLTDKVQGVLYHFFDPGNQSVEREQSLESQIFTFIVSLSGIIFLGGMLISTLINTVERRVQKIEQGLVTYKSLEGHYVIIGYGEMIISLIDEIFEETLTDYKTKISKGEVKGVVKKWRDRKRRRTELNKLPRILIMTNQDVAMVRTEIHSQIIHDVEDKILVYAGDIESADHLAKLNLHTATEVYVTGEKDEYGRDTKNIACVKQIAMLYGEYLKPANLVLPTNINELCKEVQKQERQKVQDKMLKVNVQFDRIPSYSIAQKIDLPKSFITAKGHSEPCVDYRPFNFHENWSRILWSYYSDPADGYSLLNFEKMEGDKYVHLVIVGLNRMGRALLLEALRVCHYTNFDLETGRGKTKITVIDMAMDEKLPFFKAQYPYIESEIKDIEVEFKNAKVEHADMRNIIKATATDKNALLTVAICIKDPDIGLATGLNLPEEIYFQSEYARYKYKEGVLDEDGNKIAESIINNMRPRVLIRQELHQGLSEVLNDDNDRYKNVKVFGMLNKGFSYKLLDDRLSKAVGNNYRKLVGKNNNGTSKEVLSENFKWANRYQIDLYGYYLEVLAQYNITKEEDVAVLNKFEDIVNAELKKQNQSNSKQYVKKLSAEEIIALEIQLTTEEREDKKRLESVVLMLSEVEHRRWIAERTISGWRQKQAGEERMNEFQIHDQIIPYSELDMSEKAKDYTVIKDVLKMDAKFRSNVFS